MEEDVSYIAKRYHKGKFSVEEGWKRLNIVLPLRRRLIRIAAAIVSAITLSAAATVLFHKAIEKQPDAKIEETIVTSPKQIIKVIDFENTSLPIVILKIKEVYGVEVTNLPENADELHLSLHYEGNPVDLVTTINDILDTEMTIEE